MQTGNSTLHIHRMKWQKQQIRNESLTAETVKEQAWEMLKTQKWFSVVEISFEATSSDNVASSTDYSSTNHHKSIWNKQTYSSVVSELITNQTAFCTDNDTLSVSTSQPLSTSVFLKLLKTEFWVRYSSFHHYSALFCLPADRIAIEAHCALKNMFVESNYY